MSGRRLLAVSSRLASVFFPLHVADDIARGVERAGPETMLGIAICPSGCTPR